MLRSTILVHTVVFSVLVPAACARSERAREPVVGGPCEGCEWVYEGLPAEIPSRTRIAPAGEPGEAMRIEGTVLDAEGRPVPGVIVYAYHTDDRGEYPRDTRYGVRHGRLRAWAKSDEDGRYVFDTIRPAGYPGTTIPAHVHMHVIEVGRCTYWIDDINFEDDPRLSQRDRSRSDRRGGSGLSRPARDKTGVWVVTRDIVLGENVADYPPATGKGAR